MLNLNAQAWLSLVGPASMPLSATRCTLAHYFIWQVRPLHGLILGPPSFRGHDTISDMAVLWRGELSGRESLRICGIPKVGPAQPYPFHLVEVGHTLDCGVPVGLSINCHNPKRDPSGPLHWVVQ